MIMGLMYGVGINGRTSENARTRMGGFMEGIAPQSSLSDFKIVIQNDCFVICYP